MSTDPCFVSVLEYDGSAGGGSWSVRRHDPAAPLLTAFDYAAVRGDGAFEAMHVIDGKANKPERHMERMARSLEHLGISGPAYSDWKALINDLIDQWPDGIEGVLKLVISRGQEGGPSPDVPTAYGTIVPIGADLIAQRANGIDIITLSFGYSAREREESPWLLGGTKYLSYAINMAAKREAARRGKQDVLFISADGEVLEGPNSTIIWLTGDTLHTTPSSTGILRGTTQELIFSKVINRGLHTNVNAAELDDVLNADGVWMSSSTRGVAAVKSIDGQLVAQSPETTHLLQELSGLPLPLR